MKNILDTIAEFLTLAFVLAVFYVAFWILTI